MSDVGNTRVSLHKESTPGTIPTDATWYNLNNRFPDGGPRNQTQEDDTIIAGRNPPSAKLIAGGSGWQLPWTLQYDTTGAWYQALLASLQGGSGTAATTEVTGVGGSGAVLSASGIETGIEVGDIVRVRDASNVDLGYPRVTATGSNTITVDTTSFDLLANLKVRRGVRIKNGTTQHIFGLLVSNFAPGSSSFDRFDSYKWEAIDQFQLTIAADQFCRGSFTTVGRGAEALSATYPFAGTPVFTAAPTTETMDSSNNVPIVRVAAATYAVQTVEFGWRNESEPRRKVGQGLLAESIASGLFRVQGRIRAYYNDIAEWNKSLSATDSALVTVTKDTAGNAIAWSLPRIRYGNPTRTREGSLVIAELPFTGETHATEGIGVRVVLFAA